VVRPGEGTGTGCNASPEGIANGMRLTLDQIENQVGQNLRRATPTTNGFPGRQHIDNCYALLTRYARQCNNPAVTRSSDCLRARTGSTTEGARPEEPTGVSGAQDRMITAFIAQANCQRNLGACYRYGAELEGFPTRGEVEEQCGRGLEEKIRRLGNSIDDNLARIRMQGARELYKRMDERYFSVQAQCADRRGREAEEQGRELLTTSMANRGADVDPSKFNISCIDRQESSRHCQYVANGQAKLEEVADNGRGRNDLGAPVHINGTCSAQCLRSQSNSAGCMEVLTAGHGCAEAGSRMTVYDREGNPVEVRASECRTSFDGDFRGDYAICRLEQSVNTRPVYVATYDPNVQGDQCRTEGHVMRCGVGFYQRLADQRVPVTATIFPEGGRMSFVRGHLYYDSRTNMLYHDLMTAPGASGAGIMVNINGQHVIIGAHSWAQQQQLVGGAARPDADALERLRIPTGGIATSTLQDSMEFWRDFGDGAGTAMSSLTADRAPDT